ncbi:MAG: hypothetical protein PHH09_02975 [Methanoregulaceae archaeon]|jgi:hypothetical protein|nr:hypothetical protein [Methanoregulaceae archaeon]
MGTAESNHKIMTHFSYLAYSFLAIMALAAIIIGSGVGLSTDEEMTFNYEQSTKGTGFFNSYREVAVDSVKTKTITHGSGMTDSSDILKAQRISEYNVDYEPDNLLTNTTSREIRHISGNEEDKITYTPITVDIGTGYYKDNPIEYASQLAKRTCIKNYQISNAVNHEIKYAENVNTNQQIWIENNESYAFTYGSNPYYLDPESVCCRDSITNMKFVEDVTGMIHIGATGVATSVNHEGNEIYQNIYIDEDYFGEYTLSRNITFEKKEPDLCARQSSWLCCCFGGYDVKRYPIVFGDDMTCFAPDTV